MALNYSHRPIFPAHMSEDNLVAPLRIVNGCLVQEIPEKKEEGFASSRDVNQEADDCFEYGRDRIDSCASSDLASKDIVDLLPSDPFGMDISTTVTAITEFLKDLGIEYGGYGKSTLVGSKEDYGLFAGFNFIWNNAVRFPSFSENILFDNKPNTTSQMDQFVTTPKVGDALGTNDFGSFHNSDDLFHFDDGSIGVVSQQIEEPPEVSGSCCAEGGNDHHQAWSLALCHLGVHDLLSVQRVCTSLRSIIQTDPLLWLSIHIGQPLNEKITDDILLQLTSRAQGNLRCLSLVECTRITDAGLRHVLETNPKLTKLCVPGCTKLRIEGILTSLKALKCRQGAEGVKHLRIGRLYGVTYEHFEELKFLLGTDGHYRQSAHKPHFYNRGNLYLLCDDDRPIDIELCPRCQNLRLVYDCPAEACQVNDGTTQVCRACTLCIARCVQCGRCINDREFEETFCLELLCSECFEDMINCEEMLDNEVCPAKSVVHHQLNSNNFHG